MSDVHDVCFVGLKCRDLLLGKDPPRYLGGIEKGLVTLAKGMRAQGLKIAIITFKDDENTIIDANGLTIISAYYDNGGARFIRTIHPRLTGLYSAFRQANAKIYFQMGAGMETALAYTCAMLQRRPFIYCLASDSDSYRDLPLVESKVEKRIFRAVLSKSSAVIAQTLSQQNNLASEYKLESEVIPIPYDTCWTGNCGLPTQDARVLWVGRFEKGKRLELFIELASKHPEFNFDVVGSANKESQYSSDMISLGANVKNLTFHGRVSETRLAEIFASAGVLCCTSTIEGFPTTFLEAWSRFIPVVTTFDPDGIVAKHGLGISTDKDGLSSALMTVKTDAHLYARLAKAGHTYFDAHYTPSVVIPKYREVISRVIGCEL